jgi:hypothetical protein
VAGKQRYELWGEALRDIGILLLVFVPLEFLVRNGQVTRTHWWIALGFVIFGLLLIAGIGETQAANAQAIAAVPELIAALKSILDVADENPADFNVRFDIPFKNAKDALAKAGIR